MQQGQGGDSDDIDASLQHLKELTEALEARLQQRGSEQQLLSQIVSRHGIAQEDSLSTADTYYVDDGATAMQQHSMSAGWYPDTNEAAHGALESSSAARLAAPLQATGTDAAEPPPGNPHTTGAADEEQGEEVWGTDDSRCPPHWDTSLLEIAGEQSQPYSLLTEAGARAGSVPNLQRHHKPAVPPWRQHLQQELQQQHARQHQVARKAAAAGQQQQASHQAAAWRAAQGHLPFHLASSKMPKAKHKLQKSLSHMLQESGAQARFPAAAADQPETATEELLVLAESLPGEQAGAVQVATGSDGTIASEQQPISSNLGPQKARTVVPMLDRYIEGAAAEKATALATQQQTPQLAAAVSAPADELGTAPLSANQSDAGPANYAGGAQAAACTGRLRSAAAGGTLPSYTGSPKRKTQTKADDWAAADAATNAEVTAYLKDHWQQQYLPAAALVLQCAWRSRGPRANFNRYMYVRQHNVVAAVGPPFRRWHCWTQAGKHHRQQLQRQVVAEWRELLVLQLELCRKVVRGLQRGVLSGDVSSLLTWRMCTPLDSEHSMGVKPSLGGLLATMLKQKAPHMRQQAYFGAWLKYCQQLQATRAKATVLLSAAALCWRRESTRDCLHFWRMYTTTRVCERLGIALPVFRPRLPEFEEWLWQHERAKHLKQQASALFDKSCLRRCFGAWQRHMYKVHTMRMAWTGLMLVSPAELKRHGMSAFKANWKEGKHRRQLLRSCYTTWLDVSKRNRNVAIMRRRIQQSYEHQAKCAAIQAFKRHTNMSLLISTAGTIKIWQARPLVLAHLHAWMGDSLHMTVYLLWSRWRHRARARLRFRAAIGLHMYRAHWLDQELAFTAWRKVTAVTRPSRIASGQDRLQSRHTGGATLIILSDEGSSSSSSTGASAADSSSSADPPTEVQAAAVHLNAVDTLWRPQAGVIPLAERQSATAGASSTSNQETAATAQPTTSPTDTTDQQPQHQQQQVKAAPEEGTFVFVSLADFPVGPPWRPLARRVDVMARRGLQHLSGARLAKIIRDLRELEGRYIVKDHDRGAEGLLGSMVYNKRRAVSPGLKAMVTAQLPMNTLWHATCPEDAMWWQRVVGLMQQHMPHPDSWKCFISSFTSTKPSSSSNSSDQDPDMTDAAREPQQAELHELLHGSACRVRTGQGNQQQSSVKSSGAEPAAVAQPTKPSGFKVKPLQLAAEASNLASSTQRATMVSAKVAGDADGSTATAAAQSVAGTDGQRVQIVTPDESHSDDYSDNRTSAAVGWPTQWSAENIAWLCQLVQAEELLETAVHMLLGIGSDSSEELYLKLGQMTRGQALDMQGDRLTWLLSTAVAHDITHARSVLLKARARDVLVIATMEMRQRAIALHLHFPWKFTLDSRGTVTDVQSLWSEVVRRVEAERDWDASSTESDDDIVALNSLNLQQLGTPRAPQQLELSIPGTDIQPLDTDRQQAEPLPTPKLVQVVDMDVSAAGGAGGDDVAPSFSAGHPADAADSVTGSPFFLSTGEDCPAPPEGPGTPSIANTGTSRSLSPLGRLSPETPGAAAISLVAGGALMTAGSLSTALSPGGMLAQTMGSGDLQLHRASTAATPATATYQAQHLAASIQLQEEILRVEQLRRQQKAQDKQQQQNQAAIAAAKGLFGAPAASRSTAPAATYRPAAAVPAEEQEVIAAMGEVFTVPMFASISGAHSGRTSIISSLSGSPRTAATVQSSLSSQAAVAAGASTSRGSSRGSPQVGQQQTDVPGRHQQNSLPPPQQQQQLQQQQHRAAFPGSPGGHVSPSSQTAGLPSRPDSYAHSSSTGSSASSRPGSVPSGSSRPHSSRLAHTSRRSEPGTGSNVTGQIGSTVMSSSDSSSPAAQDSPAIAAAYGLATWVSPAVASSSDVASDVAHGLREGLKTVLQSVLAPAAAKAAPDTSDAEVAAVGLAEACAQWIVEQQQQEEEEEDLQQNQQQVRQQQQQVQQRQQQERLPDSTHVSEPGIAEQDSWQHASATSSMEDAAELAGAIPTGVVQGVKIAGRRPRSPLTLGGTLASDSPQAISSRVASRGSSRPACMKQPMRPRSSSSANTRTSSPGGVCASDVPGTEHVNYEAAALSAAVQAGFSSSAPRQRATQRAARGPGGVDVFRTIPSAPSLTVSGLTGEARPAQQIRQGHRAAASRSQLQTQARGQQQRLHTGLQDLGSPRQQQQQLVKQLSSSSSTSSLPSIPSCTGVVQQIKQQTDSKRHKGGTDTQLPAITGHSSAAARKQQQRLEQEGDQVHAAAEMQCSEQDAAAGRRAIDEAVWRSPARAGPAHPAAADAAMAADLASQDTPVLCDLLQDAAQEDWQQFGAIAQELASGLAAALQARHNKPGTDRAALDAAVVTEDGQQLRLQPVPGTGIQQDQNMADDPFADTEPDIWRSQPDVPAAAVVTPAVETAAGATPAATQGSCQQQQQADLAGVVSKLMTAPLAARFIFWRQIAQQQQAPLALGNNSSSTNDPHAASQLHQLAWSTLLQKPKARRQHTSQQPASSSVDATAADAAAKPVQLEVKLKQYLQAHMQWRAQLATAHPLAPAEKWITLQHEEQVLDFITSLTVSVYMDMLRKHRGMPAPLPAAKQQPKPVLGFSSSAPKAGSSKGLLEQRAAAGAPVNAAAEGRRRRPLEAEGQAVTPVKVAVVPRSPQQHSPSVPMFTIPGPAVLAVHEVGQVQQEEPPHPGVGQSVGAYKGWDANESAAGGVGSDFEDWLSTATGAGSGSEFVHRPKTESRAAEHDADGGSGHRFSSAGSDASSWQG